MAGTLEGGKKAAKTNIERYGSDFYKRLGSIGGSRGTTGGFYNDQERARAAGSKGGRRSKKGWKFITENETHMYYMNPKTGEEKVVEK